MATYKILLIGPGGGILEEKTIKARRNYDATQAAEGLCRSAPSQCKRFEVWLRDRCVLRSALPTPEGQARLRSTPAERSS
jgi:hypothetical protein